MERDITANLDVMTTWRYVTSRYLCIITLKSADVSQNMSSSVGQMLKRTFQGQTTRNIDFWRCQQKTLTSAIFWTTYDVIRLFLGHSNIMQSFKSKGHVYQVLLSGKKLRNIWRNIWLFPIFHFSMSFQAPTHFSGKISSHPIYLALPPINKPRKHLYYSLLSELLVYRRLGTNLNVES